MRSKVLNSLIVPLKFILPQRLRLRLRALLDSSSRGLETFREVLGIKVSAGLQPGSIQTCNNYRVEIVDGHSFGILRWHIFNRRCYDFTTEKTQPRILDCGSNIGLSILRFKELYPGAIISGFEPDPTLFQILKRNIERNRCHDVELVHAALSRSEGYMSFLSDGKRLSYLAAERESPPPGWQRFDVRCIPLNGYLEQEVDFLKMNIEGAEGDVLLGLGSRVRYIREMVFEYHHMPNLPCKLHEILKLLHEHGFQYVVHSYAPFTNPAAHPPFRLENKSYTLAVYACRKQ